MEIDLAGQTALVITSGGLIAEAVRAALSEKGACVSTRHPAGAEARAVVTEVLEAVGRLNILVLISPTSSEDLLTDAPATEAVAATLAGATIELHDFARAASDALAEGDGRIVVIGSALGLLPSRNNPLGSAADAALFQLVRAMAMRLGARGVRINALALGAIGSGAAGDTMLLAGDLGSLSHVAIKRPGTVEEVADAMLFLVDPQNTYMTGHVLPIDGGWIAGFARNF